MDLYINHFLLTPQISHFREVGKIEIVIKNLNLFPR